MRFLQYTEHPQMMEMEVRLEPYEIKNLQQGFHVEDEVSFSDDGYTNRLRIESEGVSEEVVDYLFSEVPQQPSSIETANQKETYDDIILAMGVFSDFLNDIKISLENNKSTSQALEEALNRNNVKKALHTYDKHELIRQEYQK